jgi:ABC-type Fe3+-hydroxamate transport system substrate-binding protein
MATRTTQLADEGIDDAAREPDTTGENVRIVSLVPSLTELLCELGLTDRLVGRTGFCIHPREQVAGIAKVGGTKHVDIAKVRALAPTHLIVNVDENEKPAVDALREFVPNVVVTHPIEVADNFTLYEQFGRLFGRETRATQLAQQLRVAINEVERQDFERRGVLYLIWKDPWMTVGPQTYVARMLSAVGLDAVAPDSEKRYPTLDWDRFDLANIGAVLLSSEPYRFTERHLNDLASDARLAGRHIRMIDGEMVSWYGSRAIAGLRYLLEYRRRLDLERPGA